MASAVIGRQLGRNFAFEAGYVGRLGRDGWFGATSRCRSTWWTRVPA